MQLLAKLKQLKITSLKLILILSLYFGFALNIRFWQFIYEKVCINEIQSGWFLFSLVFFILVPLCWLFCLVVIPKIAKLCVVFLLLVSSVAQYMMLHYGIYIDKNMIQNIIETNTNEAFDLITLSLIIWVSITGILPALIVLFTKIIYKPFKKEFIYRVLYSGVGLLCIALFACTCFKDYAAIGRNNRQVKSLINVVNYTAGIISHTKRVLKVNKKFQILAPAYRSTKSDDSIKIFVMVLGETARAANFSLQGYNKKTNPLLEKQDIVYFNNTTSCGTATAVSVPCIYSHLSKSDFDVNDAQYTENLVDLIQKSGYDVYWQENDGGCKNVCNRVEKTTNVVVENNPTYCHGKYCYDGVLLDNLNSILPQIKKDTVIILHTMGSHGPTYYQRYPDAFKKFKPTCDTADIQTCSNEKIINTYDNTILYTDYIISSSIDLLKQYPKYKTGLLYISDHGESLGEKNMYLHGMPYAIAPKEQTHVPMLIWMNSMMKDYDKIDYACLKNIATKNEYSHDNIFHTILSLLQINTALYNKKYDIVDKCRLK